MADSKPLHHTHGMLYSYHTALELDACIVCAILQCTSTHSACNMNLDIYMRTSMFDKVVYLYCFGIKLETAEAVKWLIADALSSLCQCSVGSLLLHVHYTHSFFHSCPPHRPGWTQCCIFFVLGAVCSGVLWHR